MREQGLPVRELFGGCICCTLQSGLVETLLAVESEYDPDWVIIEPTGLAAPGDILGAVVDHCPSVDTIRVLTLVDAPRWQMLLEMVEPLVTAQLETADIVAVNKIDEVDDETLAAVMDERPLARRQGDGAARLRRHRGRHEAPPGVPWSDGRARRARPRPPAAPPRERRAGRVRGAADVVFDPPAHADQLELAITHFFAALSGGLADAGCTLVGHIKGTLAARGHGDLAFHATALAVGPP